MNPSQTADDSLHLRWPASRFYWAVLKPAVDGDPGRGAALLEELLAEELPVDVAEVHAVFVQLGERGVLACAVMIEELESLPSSVRTLGPEGLPTGLEQIVPREAVATVNLLQGLYEPACVRRARRAVWTSGLWIAAVLIMIVGIGLHVIAQADRAAAEASKRAAERAAAEALGTNGAAEEDEQQRDALGRLHDMVTRLARERGEQALEARPGDAAAVLAALLGQWPRGLPARMDSVAVGETSIRLAGSVATFDEASVLTEALKGMSGWDAEQPQVAAQGSRVSIRTTLNRAARSSRATGPMSRSADAILMVNTGGMR